MQIPFYENVDETHCFQAVLRMILKCYWPNKDFTWEELDRISAKVDGLWTCPTASLIWLDDRGFDVQSVEMFEYEKFASDGDDYLVDFFGEEVGREQIAHCDIEQETRYARQIAKRNMSIVRTPEISDLKDQLDAGWLLICNVNSRALNGKSGYSGHFVLLIGYDSNGFIVHDPGLPGRASRKVVFENFELAWAFPNLQAKNYIAIRPRSC